MISEKIELLGKGLYTDIPDVLTLKSIPTASELDFVGGEDFNRVMLEKILPEAVEEQLDFYQLLNIDYEWICRCLRILNYGPYHTTNTIYCDECGQTSYGEFQVNLNTIGCVQIPEGFTNSVVIKRDEFIDFNGDVEIQLPTVRMMLNAYKDKAFQTADGKVNRELARICYMVKSISGKKTYTPVEIKMFIQKSLTAADYIILKSRIAELTDFGLRAGGSAQCPKCGSRDAAFLALTDDRFFRPTVGDLRKWRDDRNTGSAENVSGSSAAIV